jgi:hypothetical protein
VLAQVFYAKNGLAGGFGLTGHLNAMIRRAGAEAENRPAKLGWKREERR